MKFDIFFSICQTEVDGYLPSEKKMFENFFRQVRLADSLGVGTAWIAETHLSCQVQKETSRAVIPEFKGEIGLSTDILQLAHVVFSQTKNLRLGSAIRNIICNGGPIAHAEAIRMFLTLHQFQAKSDRQVLEIGFAAGRFPFSNAPYGFYPRTSLENSFWEVIKNKYFQEASEIFLRLITGGRLSSEQISPRYLTKKDFRSPEEWQKALQIGEIEKCLDLSGPEARVRLDRHYNFEKVGVIPFEAPLELLRLTVGSHDPETQELVNQFWPVGVFNLSITPPAVIEETHQRMKSVYHSKGGPWLREYMPRTVLLFINTDSKKAQAAAQKAWENYWRAMEGTLDPKKVEAAVKNTIFGNPEEVAAQIMNKYDRSDRLMLWFDFNNHDTEDVENSMKLFFEKVVPKLA
jgi:alkanesulfonate monooxygenase SsuD/methylene tetrahydromethanopterin reductase-like flavin-dependent oxidoreductase (luciferase family)